MLKNLFSFSPAWLALAAAGVVSGADYYVAPNGSDTNPGTLARPFKTPTYAQSLVSPGDTVYMRAGTYPAFWIRTSGTASSPITYRAYPGEKPIIEGRPRPNELVDETTGKIQGTGESADEGSIVFFNVKYVVADGLTISGGLDGVDIRGGLAGYNKVLNCDVYSSWEQGIASTRENLGNNIIRGNRIWNASRQNWPRSSSGYAGAITTDRSPNNLIEGNLMFWVHGQGITADQASHGTIIRSNILADMWGSSIYIQGSRDITVENNIVYVTDDALNVPNYYGKVYPIHEKSRPIGIHIGIEENVQFDVGLTGLKVRNNLVLNGQYGIESWGPKTDNPLNNFRYVYRDWLIANNTVIDFAKGIYLRGHDGIQSINVHNNILVNRSPDPGEVSVITATDVNGPLDLGNNIYCCGDPTDWKFSWNDIDGITFAKWILPYPLGSGEPTTGPSASRWLTRANLTNLVNNVLAKTPRLWTDPSITTANSQSPYIDPNTVTIAQLREMIAANYRLRTNSPAIDTGADLATVTLGGVATVGVTQDFDGIARPQAARPDIGAFERNNGTTGGGGNTPPTISIITDQTTLEDTPISNLAFTVGDVQVPANNLTLSASSSNPTLIPAANVVFGGSGASSTATFIPVGNQSGTARITITVSDGTLTASSAFNLNVTAVNDGPIITSITDQTVNEDTTTTALPFTVGDPETSAGNLTVTASSSNPTLVPNANITLGGSGANRTVTIQPVANQAGVATITLAVSDGATNATTTFRLTVNAINDTPTISSVSNQIIDEDAITTAIPFTIGDNDTPLGNLTVSATSSNTVLVPGATIALGGSGASRTITLTPASNQFGDTLITLFVTDGSLTNSSSFLLTVRPVDDPPTLTAIADQTINMDTATSPLAFTIGDVDMPLNNLILSATSTNTTLVPNANIVFGGSGASRTVTITPAANKSGTTLITVTVNDGTTTLSKSFLLTVRYRNHAPLVDAGSNQTIEITANATLAGVVTDDSWPASSALTTVWTKTLGPGIVTFGNPNSRVTTALFSTEGFYRLRLTANDSEFATSDDVIIIVRPSSDNVPPAILSVKADQVADSSARVSWRTDEASDSVIEYGLTASYGSILQDTNRTTDHAFVLTSLTPSTTYYFRVKSRDIARNQAVSTNYLFTTLNPVLIYLPAAAESATLAAPMLLERDLWFDSRQQYIGTSLDNQGTATFTVQLPAAGTFRIWCRILSPFNYRDSFYVSVNGGPEEVYDTAGQNNWVNAWQWTPVSYREGVYPNHIVWPRSFNLAAGTHNITIRGRESFTRLNRLLITNDPDYIPADGAPVAGVATALTLQDPVLQINLNPGFSLIANQLDRGSNTVAEVLPSVPEGTILYKFNNLTGSYEINSFSDGNWYNPDQILAPGEGAFIQNPDIDPFPLAFTGVARQTSPPLQLRAGANNLVSIQSPRTGILSELLSFPFISGDLIRRFDNLNGNYVVYTYGPNGWDNEPSLNIAESFFILLKPRN